MFRICQFFLNFGLSEQNFPVLVQKNCQNFGFKGKMLIFYSEIFVFQGQHLDFWLFRSKFVSLKVKKLSKFWLQGKKTVLETIHALKIENSSYLFDHIGQTVGSVDSIGELLGGRGGVGGGVGRR